MGETTMLSRMVASGLICTFQCNGSPQRDLMLTVRIPARRRNAPIASSPSGNGRRTTMKAKLTDKQKAAKKRIDVAIAHLLKAAEEVNYAAADMSRVTGASVPYRKLTKVHEDINEAVRMLDQAAYDEKWMLDHDPTPQELRCGHGPQHGCGRGKVLS